MTDKVKVAVRVRPFSKRELDLHTSCIVDMIGNQTILTPPGSDVDGSSRQPKSFTYDHCFWSIDQQEVGKYVSQEDVFTTLGEGILASAFDGYNGCIFAYGQTGSGKSYTMMGSQENQGIIPRLCDAMFSKIQSKELSDTTLSFKVEVSYIEIYNERVHDLLDISGHKKHLKVREHNVLGPYVDGLSQLMVSSFEDIENLMSEGNKSRTVAATNMNSESSRSHAVFNVILTQTLSDCQLDVTGEKVSKLSLIDLAGSERAQKTGACGDRLREGSNINKSLTTLGLVISALAESSKTKKFVPYRDSVLTWLLKDNLGGNSRTLMVATLSPAADNYEETLSTLRYAERAKRIVNNAVVNEDPNARIIRELREEVEVLKAQLQSAQAVGAPHLTEQLNETEKLMKEMSKTWEEKLADTERRHKERHEALEKMGVSVQASGIKVDPNSCYLVNLNADPSLNELLVYYLKEETYVGCGDNQDIKLNGLGIKSEHCVLMMEQGHVLVMPQAGARTVLNGSEISTPTRAFHGDRILWGNHHYFRINLPGHHGGESTGGFDQEFNYADAQAEVLLNGASDDSLRQAMEALEQRYETDKEVALEKQKNMYEGLLKQYWTLMSPGPDFAPQFVPQSQPSAQEAQLKAQLALSRLKEQLGRANALVREANFLSAELDTGWQYEVTLEIPTHNLRRGHIATEPAIQPFNRRNFDTPKPYTWSLDDFENRLVQMREAYEDSQLSYSSFTLAPGVFYDVQEEHKLIGVGNVFLSPLFFDAPLEYSVPVINTQGEISGKLLVRMLNLTGSFDSSQVTISLYIKSAKALPKEQAKGVYLQYQFWGTSTPSVVPAKLETTKLQDTIEFEHEQVFVVSVNDEFLEFCADGSLIIEVYGNRAAGESEVKGERMGDNWSEYYRKLELWLTILELNENGQYLPVEIHHPTQRDEQGREKDVIPTGGIYQLKHGQSRRLMLQVRTLSNTDSGTLPIICERISAVEVGCVVRRDRSMQSGLDSYQEDDLNKLKDRWREAVNRRQEHLAKQLSLITSKPVKTAADEAREKSLMDQWSRMTVEKEAVLVPSSKSCVPGALADWNPPLGMEEHIPVLFLDLHPEPRGLTPAQEPPAVGDKCLIPKEHNSKFVPVTLVQQIDKDCGVICQWDASLHDSIYLNRITQNNELIYLVVKARVRLSHPVPMDLILRKRACVSVYKKRGIRSTIWGYMRAYVSANVETDLIKQTGITYQVVSSIPPATGEVEDRKSLATLAASNSMQLSNGDLEDGLTNGNMSPEAQPDGETYIKQYLSAVSAVEQFLIEEKARQEAAVKQKKQSLLNPLRNSSLGMARSFSLNSLNILSLKSPPPSQSVRDLSRAGPPLVNPTTRANQPAGGVRKPEPPRALMNLAAKNPLISPLSSHPSGMARSMLITPMKPVAEEAWRGSQLGSHRDIRPPSDLDADDFEEESSSGRFNPFNDSNFAVPRRNKGNSYLPKDQRQRLTQSMHFPPDFSRITDTEMAPSSTDLESSSVQYSSVQNQSDFSNNNISVDATVSNQQAPGSNDLINLSDILPSSSEPILKQSNEDLLSVRDVDDGVLDHEENVKTSSLNVTVLSQTETLKPVPTDVKLSLSDSVDKVPVLDNLQLHTDALGTTLASPVTTDLNAKLQFNGLSGSESHTNISTSKSELSRLTELLQSPSKMAKSVTSENLTTKLNGGRGHEASEDEEDMFGSRMDLSAADAPLAPWIQVGEPCFVLSGSNRPKQTGWVRFVGPTQFQEGNWVGIELDLAEGKNDGQVKGVRYFRCRPRHGLFVRADKLKPDVRRKKSKR